MGHSFPLFQMSTSCMVLGILGSVPMRSKQWEEETQPEGPTAASSCVQGFPGGEACCAFPQRLHQGVRGTGMQISAQRRKSFLKARAILQNNEHLEAVPASGSWRLEEKICALHSLNKRQNWNQPTCPSTGMEKQTMTVIQWNTNQQLRGAHRICNHMNGSQKHGVGGWRWAEEHLLHEST